MDPISVAAISRSLDGLALRYQATAENIANANSKGFRPLRVTFENALQAAAPFGAGAVDRVKPKIGPDTGFAPGSELRVDLELATASETAMRYAALLDLLGRQMQISRTIVRGGQ